jgi:hypothetical protein
MLEKVLFGVGGNKDGRRSLREPSCPRREVGLFIVARRPLRKRGVALPESAQTSPFSAAAVLESRRGRADEERPVAEARHA